MKKCNIQIDDVKLVVCECFSKRPMPDTCQSYVLILCLCNPKPRIVLMVRLNYLMVTRQKLKGKIASAAKVKCLALVPYAIGINQPLVIK